MKLDMKKFMLMVSCVIMMNFLLVSCSLDDGAACPQAFTGELSVSESEFVGTWVLTNMVSEDEVDLTDDNVENPSTEIFQQLSDCRQDVVYNFQNDRKYSIKQGFNATNCTNKQSLEGTWKLAGNKLSLVTICTLQTVDILINNEVTVFTYEATFTFQDVKGLNINTTVTSTYEKTL